MLKKQELSDPNSCLNRSQDDEMLFVLTARDAAAPAVIREWVSERMRLGKNKISDPQIREALDCATFMEEWRGRSVLDTSESTPLPPVRPTPPVSLEFSVHDITAMQHRLNLLLHVESPCREQRREESRLAGRLLVELVNFLQSSGVLVEPDPTTK